MCPRKSDPQQRTTSFDYTSIPGATKITDPAGNVTVDQYQNGLLVAQTKGYGVQPTTWAYSYDPDTLAPTSVLDPENHLTTSTYDGAGNELSRTDPLGRTTNWTYNVLNEVTSMQDANQVTTSYTYDAAGNLLSASTPLVGSDPAVSKTTGYTYGDPSHPGDVTLVTDPDAKAWPRTYDTYGNLASVTDPLGNQTGYCYDGVARKTKVIAPKGSAAGVTCATQNPTFTTTITPNAYGDPLSVSDPLGHQTIYSYDANRNRQSVQDPDGHIATSTYDPANQLTQVTRADSPATTLRYEYDPDGRLQNQYDGANQRTTYSYDALGRLIQVTDPLIRSTSYGYDGAGNRRTKQDPGGNCIATPKVACTTMAYDVANRLTSITYSDGATPNVTSIAYDNVGRHTSMTDGTGTSSWVWDSLGRLTSQTNGAGQPVGYGYDLRGDNTTITYPGATGTVTRTFDDAGRLWKVKDWANRETVFSYDADSFLTSQAYPNGTTATYTPDGGDRLMGVSHAPTVTPGSPFASFTYGRDNADLLTSVTSTGVPTDNHTWGYTPLNQLKTDSAASYPYTYDPADNLTQHANGQLQGFDVANQLTGTGVSGSVTLVGTAKAGDGGSTSSITVALPSGTAAGDFIVVAATLSATKTASTPTGYTLVGHWTSGSQAANAKVSVFKRVAVAGDANVTVSFGQKYAKTVVVAVYRGISGAVPIDGTGGGSAAPGTSVTASVTPTRAADRLVMITGATSSPSAGTWTAPSGMTMQAQQAGGTTVASAVADQNLGVPNGTQTRTATYSPSAQLVGVLLALRPTQGATYGYDTRGNRVTTTSNADVTTTLAYDQANRLTSHGGGSTYAYDGDGLRMSKTVLGSTSAFVWDVAEGLPLLLVDGTTNYVYGPSGLPLEQITSGGAVTYYHHDQLGSTRALTNSSGAVVATYTYDPYGKLTASTGSATNPFGFAGQYTDAETGFQYLRARYYDPSRGQFLSVDPAFTQTFSRYGYVDGNPLNADDPEGLGLCITFLSKNCKSFADQHPALVPALAGVAGGGLLVAGGATLLPALLPAAPTVEQNIQSLLMPGGSPIGTAGSDATIREVQGGLSAAQKLFERLSEGCTAYTGNYAGQAVNTPEGGFIGLRASSTSGPPTIDVNTSVVEMIKKVKFPW